MNIFGVGGPELVVILVIMLVFAGPKRMIHWSYILGQYLAKFRTMWAQTVDLVQKEFDEAGVDIKLPKEPPTRKNISKSISDALEPVTKPLQESMDEIKKDVDSVKAVSKDLKTQTSEISDELKDKTEIPASKPKTAMKSVNVYSKPKAKDVQEKASEVIDGKPEPTTAPETQPVNNSSSSLGTWSTSSADK